MTPVVFFNVAWMNAYRGLKGDQPTGGGSWVRDRKSGGEVFNFAAYRGRCYGYVRTTHAGHIDLTRLGASPDAEYVDGVTVVWLAKHPTGGLRVVGWYRDARVYRDYQPPPAGAPRRLPNERKPAWYCATTLASHATCLDLHDRELLGRIPRNSPGAMGQSNVWYAHSRLGRRVAAEVLEFIEGSRRSRPRVGNLADRCIYTIAKAELIDQASRDGTPLCEGRPWTTGQTILRHARSRNETVAVVFADARDCSALIGWSPLRKLSIRDGRTEYWIGSVYGLPRGRSPQDLIKLSTRKRIRSHYIRPYVPCVTPEFLHRAARSPSPWSVMRFGLSAAREGRVKLQMHLRRERDQALARAKREGQQLVCEACGSDFRQMYGDDAVAVFDVHHRRALRSYRRSGGRTTLDDLAIVCANCHRVLHRNNPMIDVADLGKRIRASVRPSPRRT